MKIFLDTNVYIAEALVGGLAQVLCDATLKARWRIYTTDAVLNEIFDVLTKQLDFNARTARLVQQRAVRRSKLVMGGSTVVVPDDPKDSPILQAALGCGAHVLVTNDKHLLKLDPCESLRILSMSEYHQFLSERGLID